MSIRVCVPSSTRTVQSTTQSPTAPCRHRRRSNSCWTAGPTSTSETAYVNNTLCHLLFDKDMFRCYQRQRMWTIPYIIFTFNLTKTCSVVKVGSHYERLFQRWPAFEKSNKWAQTSAKLRSREEYFSFTLRTFYIRRNSTFTNVSKRLTAFDSVC